MESDVWGERRLEQDVENGIAEETSELKGDEKDDGLCESSSKHDDPSLEDGCSEKRRTVRFQNSDESKEDDKDIKSCESSSNHDDVSVEEGCSENRRNVQFDGPIQERKREGSVFRNKRKERMTFALSFSDVRQRVISGENFFGNQKAVTDEDCVENRDVWIPHPEKRETIPSVCLYSVLIGGLPPMPPDIELHGSNLTDWQLATTAALFDNLIPPESGFSSAVAAISVFPNEEELAAAWRKWAVMEGKLRRLRFIRRLINQRRKEEEYIEFEAADEGDENSNKDPVIKGGLDISDKVEVLASQEEGINVNIGDFLESVQEDEALDYNDVSGILTKLEAERNSLTKTYENVTGIRQLEPEQAAVFARETSQIASGCCPVGCHEEKVRDASLKDLLELDRESVEDFRKALQELQDAQSQVKQGQKELSQSISEDIFRKHIFTEFQDESSVASVAERAIASTADGNLPNSSMKSGTSTVAKWAKIESMVTEARQLEGWGEQKSIHSGTWSWNGGKCFSDRPREFMNSFRKWKEYYSGNKNDAFPSNSSCAILTFTSRRAAVAARQSLVDGRGTMRWKALSDIPIPPLADAPPAKMCPCRNCCRPVTLTISPSKKMLRRYM